MQQSFGSTPNDRLPFEAVAIAEELRERQRLIKQMLDDSFPAQRAFIIDPARRLAAQTTRRAGKTMGISLRHVKTAVEKPGANQLYTGLTRDACKRILKEECLEPLCEHYRLRNKWNGNEYTFTFKDYDSILYLLGVDANEKERKKALGGKYSGVTVDEAGSYAIDQRDLIYKILMPATADHRGWIAMTGTPEDNIYSLFYDVTTGREKGWSTHWWSSLDNPYMREQWLEQIEQLLSENPNFEQTATYQQMYLGKWVINPDKLVYRFNPDRDLIDELPQAQYGHHWHNVLGVDLGFEDDSAFTLEGYREHDPTCYIQESYKRAGMDLTDVATLIKQHFIPKYQPERFIIDGADKQAVEELKKRHNIPFISAEKSAKADFIHIMNDDFVQGRIKLVRSKTAMLQEEYKTLVWDERQLVKGKRVEDPKCPNHCADSTLYPWRYVYNYIDRGPAPQQYLSDEDRLEAWEEQQDRLGIEQRNRPFWER